MAHPTPGEDYPRTLEELQRWFSEEGACRDYLDELRWGEGGEKFDCPRCGHPERWQREDGTSICQQCRKQIPITVGTIFENTNLDLRTWFHAAWLVGAQKHGISAKGIQQSLGLGSYKTAWSLFQKLRRAMIRPGRDRLHGHVEVDETFVGGTAKAAVSQGRKAGNKEIVAIAVEFQPGRLGMGRVRLATVDSTSRQDLFSFIFDNVKPGSTIHTDGWSSYQTLPQHFYFHSAIPISNAPNSWTGSDLMPAVHRVAGLLKRWWLGTHQGAISGDHLDGYLDEFTFRFNRRTANHRGLLFHRLMQYAAEIPPVPYRELTA